MEVMLPLTKLQAAGWGSAKRESLLAEDRIDELKAKIESSQEQLETEARIASSRYMGVLEAIFAEHGISEVPADTRLEQNGEVYSFVYSKPDPVKVKKRTKKKKLNKKLQKKVDGEPSPE
jgi:hypothetical protein